VAGSKNPLPLGMGSVKAASEIDLWHIFPEMIRSVFSGNVVAVVFVTSIVLNLILPKEMGIEKIEEA
jgi:NCS2 family nucleobase:cation symporter-2